MTSRDFHSDDAKREDSRRECARVALALTALFDAEAGAAEARLAESHLESCAQCAWLMQSWTSSRYVLRHLPVPEVPPGLLMRVLLAVRLMSFAKRGAGLSALPPITSDPKTTEARDARLLAETLLLSGAHSFAPRRLRKTKPRADHAVDLPPLDASLPQPPADLHALILSRTVGSAPLIATPIPLAVEAFEAAAKPLRRPLWAGSKSFSASLLPVAAAWLFVLARVPQWAETMNYSVAPVAVSALSAPERGETHLSRQPVAPRIAKLDNRARLVAEKRVITPIELASAPQAPRFASASLRRDDAPVPEVNNEALEADSSPAILPNTAILVSNPVVKPQPKVARLTNFTPAVSVTPIAWGARQAAWSAPNVPNLDERAAQWHGASRHATPPSAVSDERGETDAAPDDAPDAAEILDHVARLSDSRPDDVRDVMDDFRSALVTSPDEAPTASDAEIG